METKKKEPPITGLGNDPENQLVVQKSKELSVLFQSDMSLPEFKLLDAYLARIDSHHPERDTVVLSKGEIETALGMKQIKPTDLAERLLHIGQGIRVDDPTKKSGFRIIWLLDKAECSQDEYGQWTVTMSASKSAMNFFFNLDNIGYIRYKLRCVSCLTSRYAYCLFTYVEENRWRRDWEVPLDKLKRYLGCETVESYREYKEFNRAVLKRYHDELERKTECKFEYEPVRRGRSVVAIRFKADLLPKEIASTCFVDPNQYELDDYLDEGEYEGAEAETVSVSQRDTRGLLRDALTEFTDAEADVLIPMVLQIPHEMLPWNSSLELQQYSYLDDKIKRMNLQGTRRKIRSRFDYLKKMIQEDIPEGEAEL